jgi:hypothetical protein
MTTAADSPRFLSRRKKILFVLVFNTLVLLLFLIGTEFALRRKGLRPWIQLPSNVVSMSSPTLYDKHPTLGYISRPGEFRFTLTGDYTFKTTQGSNGLRITHPLNTYRSEDKKEIWIFGCSFTWGWALNDEETFPWLVQEKFTRFEVVNFGMGAYSNVQSLIQFREALKSGKKPAVVVLAYGSFHDARNTLTRTWVKTRLSYGDFKVTIPYMRWSSSGKPELLYTPLEYHEIPLARHSALANFLDDTYDRWLESTYHSHEVSKAIIEEFFNICKENGVVFVVAGIFASPATAEMLDYCRSKGMMGVDISIDASIKENTVPYDGHPSAIANRQFAQKLNSFLCSQVMNQPPCSQNKVPDHDVNAKAR